MTTPTAPPEPAAPPPPSGPQPNATGLAAAVGQSPTAGSGSPVSPATGGDAGQNEPAADAGLQRALDAERANTRRLTTELAALRQTTMTEQERAVAAARDEGRAEAAQAAALELAAEMFRTAAAGRIADPEAHLEMLDVGKLLRDGRPDRRKITALVDRLAASVPAAPLPPGHVPAGPRAPAQDGDWLRGIMRG